VSTLPVLYNHLVTRLSCLLIPVLFAAPALANDDCENCKDYPGVSRMPGFYISELETRDFDSQTFTVAEGTDSKEVTVEGRKWSFRFNPHDGATTTPSALQIVRNYQNAVRAAGGQILYELNDGDHRVSTLRFRKAKNEVWMAVEAYSDSANRYYFLHIIEKEAMKQEVTANAAAMSRDINTTGRVALYGIFFDTGKSEIKPESAAAIAEIAKMLQETPALKLYVVGHTDNVGAYAANLTLSKSRADAVVAALTTKHGIAAARLVPHGAGPVSPVEPNDNEDGRARNRRVELVKQ
jgi:outer membrane protein OmpA-like peptidoglycan-associated protein